MGNTCCNNAKDEYAKDYKGKNKNMDPAFKELLENAAKNEDKIVKIQAGWKGH
jgi:hypothetical protein